MSAKRHPIRPAAYLLSGALAALLFLCGCSSSGGSSEFREARRLITAGEAECVLITVDGRLVPDRGRGVSPLLNLYDHHAAELHNAVVVDKVIGRAAAAIAILGKAKHVHGEVMSEDAVAYLQHHGISAGYSLLVPRILNAKRDGLCPLERSVEGIEDPAAAVQALRRRIAELRHAGAAH